MKLSIDPISVMIFAKYFNSRWRYQSSNVPTSRSPQEELPQFRTSEKWADDVFALLGMCGARETMIRVVLVSSVSTPASLQKLINMLDCTLASFESLKIAVFHFLPPIAQTWDYRAIVNEPGGLETSSKSNDVSGDRRNATSPHISLLSGGRGCPWSDLVGVRMMDVG